MKWNGEPVSFKVMVAALDRYISGFNILKDKEFIHSRKAIYTAKKLAYKTPCYKIAIVPSQLIPELHSKACDYL